MVGTPSYMAPEVFSGGEVSEKVDVFAYAVLLWECITGLVPWEGLQVMQARECRRLCRHKPREQARGRPHVLHGSTGMLHRSSCSP